MRVFTAKMGTCPQNILTADHWRNDGACLCDGKPAFEMRPCAIVRWIDGEWVLLTTSWEQIRTQTRWHRWIAKWMSTEGWPQDWSNTCETARQLSEEMPNDLFGACRPQLLWPTTLYKGGYEVEVFPDDGEEG